VFEEKIEKPLELYLHANSNVVSMNSLNTVIANAIEKSKLWEAGFDGGNESSKLVSIIIFGRFIKTCNHYYPLRRAFLLL
jgi:hypothetical protein